MVAPKEHPALVRLLHFERRHLQPPRMGYQPGLDGVRALSVVAVILYHAGFSWMHGGFFGVEVFFVVSGFLITALLIEEREREGRVGLRQFWLRRFRRLLPALAAVLVAVGVWAVFSGSLEQHSQLRRDYPWSIFYFANWGQIFGAEPYFSPAPSLLRHLWSLAVEEQWYVLWPLVFVAITRRNGRSTTRGVWLAVVSIGVMVGTAVASITGSPTRAFNPLRLEMQSVDTTNFLYLSTITRSSGLLLGAALAFVWRPWRMQRRPSSSPARSLDAAAFVAVVVLVASFFVGRLDHTITYRAILPAVTVASAVIIAAVVHPATSTRVVFGLRPLVEIGKRSYGLYLWSWPISRVCGAYEGSYARFLLAMLITVPVSELCYRFVETPIRAGVIGRWWRQRSASNWRLVTSCVAISAVVPTFALGVFYVNAAPAFDAAKDTSVDVEFDAGAALGADTTSAPPPSAISVSTDAVAPSSTSTTDATPTTLATLPRRLVIVGDSTAHSLAINLPSGIESTFTVADGSVEGCSVYDGGTAVSARGVNRGFGGCVGWDRQWVSAAQSIDAEVALVVIGAWDVFDVKLGTQVQPFASAAVESRFVAGVQRGIDALTAIGVKVALLEVPCMRPKDVQGAGVPALPERAMDDRVERLNELLRQIAADNAETTTFVEGPSQYCTDETIANDLGYRWDGVHAFKPGAKLTIEAAAAAILAIPVP